MESNGRKTLLAACLWLASSALYAAGLKQPASDPLDFMVGSWAGRAQCAKAGAYDVSVEVAKDETGAFTGRYAFRPPKALGAGKYLTAGECYYNGYRDVTREAARTCVRWTAAYTSSDFKGIPLVSARDSGNGTVVTRRGGICDYPYSWEARLTAGNLQTGSMLMAAADRRQWSFQQPRFVMGRRGPCNFARQTLSAYGGVREDFQEVQFQILSEGAPPDECLVDLTKTAPKRY